MSTSSALEELRRRNRELTILNAIAEALNREVDLERALQTTLALVAQLLDLRTGWIWLLREGTGESYLAAAQNLPSGLASEPRRMTGSCHCLETYRNGDLKGAANVNVVTCSRLEALVDGTGGLCYHASVPLYAHGKKLGVVNLASADWRELSSEDLRLLYTVGDLVSMAIERARLFASSLQYGAIEERNRLAREIHDTLAQGITGIVLHLETVDAMLSADAPPEETAQVVAQALALSRANLEEARRSMSNLRAVPLESRTLAEALTLLAQNEQARAPGLEIKFALKGKNRPLPDRLETGLYRIAQEAMSNSLRHARAGHAIIELVILRNQVRLSITDDGQGFDAEYLTAATHSGYGLIGMNERAKLLGGTFQVSSSPGKGTQIEVTVPLPPEAIL